MDILTCQRWLYDEGSETLFLPLDTSDPLADAIEALCWRAYTRSQPGRAYEDGPAGFDAFCRLHRSTLRAWALANARTADCSRTPDMHSTGKRPIATIAKVYPFVASGHVGTRAANPSSSSDGSTPTLLPPPPVSSVR